jgi:uncharacterized surface protein with fasciclin (FAS1) repeats
MQLSVNTQSKFALGLLAAAGTMAFVSATAVKAQDVMVGGAPMLPSKTIVENASQAKNLTTLVAAVKAAGLVETLSSKGPFTVFAPTNDAFAKLPKGTVETLLKPENKKKLTKILTAHVVAGDVSASALTKMIKDGKGHANLKTVSGDKIVARAKGGKVTLTDESGGVATVTIADVKQSNGVVHVIDAVLLPK